MKIIVAEIYTGYNRELAYVTVYKNPQNDEIQKLGGYFRGIIDEAGNLYAWDKPEFLYEDAKQNFNIPNGLNIAWTPNSLLIINNNYTIDQFVTIIQNAKQNLFFIPDTMIINVTNNNTNDIKRYLTNDMKMLNDIYQFDKTKLVNASRLKKLY